MTSHSDQRITLRSAGELADALPYVMGFHPDDSVVMVALHGDHGRFGGRLRLGIPHDPDEWPVVAGQLAECLIEGSARRGDRPVGVIVYLCQDPEPVERGRPGRRPTGGPPSAVLEQPPVVERLRPLAQSLRIACGRLDVPVVEALCISDGKYWSYCCPSSECCPPEGTPLVPMGTSEMAAAATYAGIQVRGSIRDMEARLEPGEGAGTEAQEQALDAAGTAVVPRILGTDAVPGDREGVRDETLALATELMARLRAAPVVFPAGESDARDDALISDAEAASMIVGLQDRTTRDRAAEWFEDADVGPALRLWRALARRCVGPYGEHAAAPLTLAGWVSWSSGDGTTARVAFARALRSDPEYLFAKLLNQAVNDGLDPEPLRRSLRRQRAGGRGRPRSARPRGASRPDKPEGPDARPGKRHKPPRGAGRRRTGGRSTRGSRETP